MRERCQHSLDQCHGEHPRELGGFVEGMNGEDTDISLRIGELGFHSVVDPKIRYISEVPTSYRHMREQRMRWFRSVFHISSRCRDLIYSKEATLRRKVILPYMLVNSARRAMLVPLIIFGLIEYLSGFNPSTPIVWQSIVAVGIGAPAIMAVIACLLNGLPKAIVALPEYLMFRLLRAYFTLESMLGILIQQDGHNLETPVRLDIVSANPLRIA
jgi:cellulose synthase/poly-beta-1,6-N-acetylglucosamine synthase-like glycosyltransferase